MAQPRPGTFERVAVDFALAVPIQIPGVLAGGMIDNLVPIAVGRQKVIDGIAIGVDAGAALDPDEGAASLGDAAPYGQALGSRTREPQ